MGLFSRSTQTIGLDIGSSSIKVMELIQDKKNAGWRLKTFGSLAVRVDGVDLFCQENPVRSSRRGRNLNSGRFRKPLGNTHTGFGTCGVQLSR